MSRRRSRDLAGVGERAVLEQHAELVAAQAGQGVGLAHAGAQQRGDLLEHLVAGEVAAGVVDHLELVEVEVEEGVLRARSSARGVEAVLQALLELAAVDQAGERVVAREVDHLALHAAELGDVLEHQDGADRAPWRSWIGATESRMANSRPSRRDQHGVARELDDPPFGQAALDRVGQRLAGRSRRQR